MADTQLIIILVMVFPDPSSTTLNQKALQKGDLGVAYAEDRLTLQHMEGRISQHSNSSDEHRSLSTTFGHIGGVVSKASFHPPTTSSGLPHNSRTTLLLVHDGHIVTEPVKRKGSRNPKRMMDSSVLQRKALLDGKIRRKGDVLDAEVD
ncbi:hypothetical protein Tco_0369782 [Tanacetum coccineum]